MNIGLDVEYQTGIAEFARGAVTAFDSNASTVIIEGCEYPVPLHMVIEVSALPAFANWREKWLSSAALEMASIGLDLQDAELLASDNEDTLRADFKSAEVPDTSAKKLASMIAHLPRFDNHK